MMQSPIPSAFWSSLFKGVVVTTAAATLFSLYHEKWSAGHEPIAPALKVLRAQKLEYDTAIEALKEILNALDTEARQKRGAVKLYVRSRSVAATLVKLMKYNPEAPEESAQLCHLIFRIVSKAFAQPGDPAGRDAWHAAGGHKKLLSLVSIAHKEGHAKLMDEAAQALRDVSAVDEQEINLPLDIPEGSQGALALCHFGSTVKMLRVLDKSARTPFLIHITAVFASVVTLHPGARAIAPGVDGHSGAWYFLELLDPRGNQMLNEHCARALQWISIHAKETHPELAEAPNVVRVVDLLDPMQTTPTIHSLLGLVASLASNDSATKFLTEFMASNGLTALIRLWCKADERETRERAEQLVRLLSSRPQCTDEVLRLLELHRPMLIERRAKDDEAMRKAQQQRQQQQMMQQQMMMQMAQSGQLPPGMMDDE
jgi:hypothetical protein